MKMTIEQIMHRVQKRAGGGKIAVSLSSSGNFYAHAYRTPEQVKNDTPAKVADRGGSVSLKQLDDIRDELTAAALAYGTGRDIAAALGDLADKLPKAGG